MRFLLLPILFLFLSNTPNDSLEKQSIKLPEHYTVKELFSCKLKSLNSFHFIIAKNKNNSLFSLIPLFPDKKSLITFKPIEFKGKPNILSYHNNEEVLTIVLSIGAKGIQTFYAVDINTATKETFKSAPRKWKYFKTTLRKDYESLILLCDGNGLRILKIVNANYIEEINVQPSDKTRWFFVNLKKFNCDGVTLDEYVANGSIKRFKAYSINDELVITEDNIIRGYSTVMKLRLDEGDLNSATHLSFETDYKKLKKLASFYEDNKFYQLAVTKDSITLFVNDLTDRTTVKHDLLNVEIHYSADEFTSVDDFIYNSNRLTSTPTIAVNETVDLNKLVRIDYVPMETYNYYHNYWFNQQHLENFTRNKRHGPSPAEEVPYSSSLNSKEFFEILLDLDSNVIVNSNDITLYRDIDKKKLVREFVEFNALKCISSSVFVGAIMYNLVYKKKTRMLTLYKAPV